MKEINDAVWSAVVAVWEDVGHRAARPIIALLERGEIEQAAQMVDEAQAELSPGDAYGREAYKELAEEIANVMETSDEH